jgi:hypothetical protein
MSTIGNNTITDAAIVRLGREPWLLLYHVKSNGKVRRSWVVITMSGAQVIIPGSHKSENSERGERGTELRQNQVPVDLELGSAIDAPRINQFAGMPSMNWRIIKIPKASIMAGMMSPKAYR